MSSDNDAMRLAFEQYMMKSSNIVQQPKVDAVSQAEKEAREEELRKEKLQQQMKQAEKRYWHIFQNFGRMVQEEWLDIDDQAYQVVEAIAGIRSRLSMQAKLLDRFKDVVQKKEWACHGYNNAFMSRGNGNVLEEDVELALSHDLIQHERMMDGLRGLFANLSEYHEALLRHLDEISKHHLECMEEFEGCDVSQAFLRATSLVAVMHDTIAMLSLELYRKQRLVHVILETVEDELIQVDGGRSTDASKGDDVEWEDLGPQGAVDRCFIVWSRQSKHSCIEEAALTTMLDMLN
jgi:hypothetical protein